MVGKTPVISCNFGILLNLYDHCVLEMLWARHDSINEGVNNVGLDETERNLLEQIRRNKNVTLRELAAATDTSLSSVERKIRKLN